MVEVGLFTSALRVADVARACELASQLGFRVVQFGKLPDDHYRPEGVRRLAGLLAASGLTCSALCIVFDGESYADLEAVRRTVGFLPAEQVEARVTYATRVVDAAAELGVGLVTTHPGLLPAEPGDPGYARVQRAVDRLAERAASRGLRLGIETGQESAEELRRFIERLEAPAGVNFDGANFVAYQTDEPLAALELLRDRLVGVHVKDYLPPASPGQLGRPCPIGQGVARVEETVTRLVESGYSDPLILETYDRDDPVGRVAESRAAVVALLDGLERGGYVRPILEEDQR